MNIEIAAGKKLTFFYDQQLDVQDQLDITFSLYDASVLDAQFIFAGRPSTRCSITIRLLGERARATLQGAYFLTEQEQFELNVEQEHHVAHSESSVVCRGVLAGSSYAKYNGLITIYQDAPQSAASQENKNILLDGRARALSIPNLQALNNDVQCSHASAVGPLDKEQLWYMQTRGMEAGKAKKLLLESFFADIVVPDRLPSLLERLA